MPTQDYDPVDEDTHGDSAGPGVPQGVNVTTGTGVDDSLKNDPVYRHFCRVALAPEIPDGAIAESVSYTLSVGKVRDTTPPSNNCRLHRVTDRTWTESGLTWNNMPQTSGEGGSGVTTTDEHQFTGPTATGSFSITDSTGGFLAQVQLAIDNDYESSKELNFRIRTASEVNTADNMFTWKSSENTGTKPKISVTYRKRKLLVAKIPWPISFFLAPLLFILQRRMLLEKEIGPRGTCLYSGSLWRRKWFG